MNYRKRYGSAQNWKKWKHGQESLNDIKENQEYVSFYRKKNSHKGISKFKKIKYLIANQVNSSFLEEICELSNIEYLNLEVVTAESLECLENLPQLKTLYLYGPRKISDFSPLLHLPSLQNLFIENAKHLSTLDCFSEAHKLIALGVEGSMYTKQKIDSLKPLSGLKRLEAIFMASVQLRDKNLQYLASIPNLRVLDAARFAPKKKFVELRAIMPDLDCNWCENYEITYE